MRRLCFLLALFSLACGVPTRPASPDAIVTLKDLLLEGRDAQPGRFARPADASRSAMRTFAINPFAQGAPQGFRRSRLHDGVLVLLSDEPALGMGVYAFRERAAPLVIEVPHSFFDLHTLDLGMALFEAAGAHALLVNSAHRYRAAGCRRGARDCPSDVAHADTLFQSAHEGTFQANPQALFVSLHGFAPREELAVDAIVSAVGTDADAGCIARGLASADPELRVRLFPQEINELGGISNIQGAHLREHSGQMVHLELGLSLRRRLLVDEILRDALTQVLVECVSNRDPVF